MNHPHRAVSLELALFLAFAASACHHVTSGSGAGIFGTEIHVQGVARFLDVDMDGVPSQGDVIIVGFDGPVRLNTADPSELDLPAPGDSFGLGATLVEGPAANEVTVVLGVSAQLRTRGTHVGIQASADIPSGIDISANLTPNAIENAVTGADAEPSPTGPLDIVPGYVDAGELEPDIASTVSAMDLNHDGNPDAVTGYDDGRFAIQFGTGDGFGPTIQYTTLSGAGVRVVALGDVDGDGDPDIVLGTTGSDEVWLNDSNGFFLPGTPFGAGVTRDLALADFDCDGVLEIATVGEGPSLFFENDGTGTFTDAGIDLGQGPANALGALDFDRDGDVDLVIGADGMIALWIDTLREDGDFTFGEALGSADTRAIAVGDLDGDGFPDFIAGNDGPNVTWMGTGTTFVADQVFPDASDEVDLDTHTLLLLDADGDGHIDLIEGFATGARAWWNDGTGFLVLLKAVVSDNPPIGLAVADIDGDGDLDPLLAFAGAAPRQYRGSLTGTWGEFGFRDSTQELGLEATLAVTIADVDRDGRLDFAAAGNHAIEVWSNDGIGPQGQPLFVTPPVVLPSPGGRILAIEFVDLDCDGDPDLLAAVQSFGVAAWLNEDGLLAPVAGTFGSSPMSGSLAVGDVDGDGDLDLVVGVMGLAPDEILLNLGRDASGAWLGFSNATPLPEEPLSTGAVALGDLDGDGDLDLVTGHLGILVPDRLWLGDGAGGFTLVATTLLGELNTRDIVFGDVDLDGDLDMVVGSNKANRLWRNDGMAGFAIGDSFDFPFADTSDIELTDLDGDGDLDLVVGNGPNIGIQIWLNGGLATGEGGGWTGFSEEALTLERVRVESLALGDLDGDGDPDLISGNGGDVPNQLWVNR